MQACRILDSLPAIELLRHIFSKLLSNDTHAQDIPILVSLDTETSNDKLCELGISSLDPLCLSLRTRNEPDSLNSRITTYCYAKGGSKDRYSYKPYRMGTPCRLCNDKVPQILNTRLTPVDSHGNTRKVILIGHGINCDLHTLQRHSGIDLSRLPNVEAILDTSSIGQRVLKTPQRPSLKEILVYFDLEFIGLHNAAHDSRYTLRALLMLFTKFEQQRTNESESDEVMLETLPEHTLLLMEGIARCHRIREGRKWCPTTRIKSNATVTADADVFRTDPDDDDDGVDGVGIAALFG